MALSKIEQPAGKTESNWYWLGHYAVAILLALLLGALLGSFSLFRDTAVPGTKLKASELVNFLGYGGALLLFWLVARRTSGQLEKQGGELSFLQPVVMPLVMLVLLSLGYQVLLLVTGPFLEKTGRTVYNWTFMVGIIGASLWLTLAWLRDSAPLLDSMAQKSHSVPEVTCQRCNALLFASGKFCVECGARLPRSSA